MIRDFSQSGEQATILEWADRHGPGRWLDLGAADGETASNTRTLSLEGWPGVAVEPAALLFDKLATLYADRDDVACVQAAIVIGEELDPGYGLDVAVNETPLVRFHYSHDLVSTTQEENAETWAELASFTPCYVAAVTVRQLLDMLPGPYDMVSIDTEGTSLELFDDLRRLDAFAPGALVVVECEDGGERWTAQQACLEGWARLGVTPNNLLLERL